MAEDSGISWVDGAFKLLPFLDPVVRKLAWDDLSSFVEDRTRGPVNRVTIAEFPERSIVGLTVFLPYGPEQELPLPVLVLSGVLMMSGVLSL